MNEPQVKIVFSIREVSEALGLHPNTVRALISRGELRATRVGRRILVSRKALDDLLGAKNPTAQGGAR
jgi:excisionase family DNA binding protein